MKKNQSMKLVLLGTILTLYGCGQDSYDNDLKQNTYASYQDCMNDWQVANQRSKTEGFDDLCKEQKTYNNNTHTFISTYLGPRYYTLSDGRVQTLFTRSGQYYGGSVLRSPLGGKSFSTGQSYSTNSNKSSGVAIGKSLGESVHAAESHAFSSSRSVSRGGFGGHGFGGHSSGG
jgi:hypothetical protein